MLFFYDFVLCHFVAKSLPIEENQSANYLVCRLLDCSRNALYNLKDDPAEKNPLNNQFPDKTKKLSEKLFA